MKIQLSYFTFFIIAVLFSLTSCEKENFDNSVTTYEEPVTPIINLDGDTFLGFSFARPIGGGFSVFGGSTNNATITVTEEDGIPTYTIDSYVEDGDIWVQKIVFQSYDTAAGDYVIKELAFATTSLDYSWDESKINGLLTISDFSGDPNYVDGSITALIDDDSGDEFQYNFSFVFVPFL